MGTSLSGLTPATTFDGLLKTGDNDPIGATLKTISDGSGTDTMLELSTTALQIGGATGMYWDNTNKRLGINNTSPNGVLEVDGVAYLNGLTYINNQDYVFGNSSFSTSNTIKAQGSMIVGDGANPTSTLQVVGSGTTSATTSLLVQNSAGTDLMKVNDDGSLDIKQGGNNAINVSSSRDVSLRNGQVIIGNQHNSFYQNTCLGFSGAAVTPGARLHVKGSGNTNLTTSLLVQNSDGTDMLSVKDDLSVVFNSTITSASSTLRFDVGGVGTIRMNSDKVAIGGNTTPTARLQVKGSGTTSATTALLVQNSDGTELMALQDDGATRINLNNTLKLVNNSGSTRVTFDGEGNLGIREGAPQARIHIKGAGTTAATTALLVRNSAGTDLLKVTDDNKVYASEFRASSLIYNGTLLMTSNRIYSASSSNGTLTWNNNNLSYNDSAIPTPIASAAFQVDSTTKGFLPPRMTSEQKAAITSPAAGLMVYDTDQNQMNYYNGTGWVAF